MDLIAAFLLSIMLFVFLSCGLLALAVGRVFEKTFEDRDAEGAPRPCGSGKKLRSEQSRENPFASSHPKHDDTLTGARSEQSHGNPYAAPAVVKALVDPTIGEMSQATQIRHEHINHEASIRGIGILFYVSSLLVILVAIAAMLFIFQVPKHPTITLIIFGIGSLIVLFAVVQGWAARSEWFGSFVGWCDQRVGIDQFSNGYGDQLLFHLCVG